MPWRRGQGVISSQVESIDDGGASTKLAMICTAASAMPR